MELGSVLRNLRNIKISRDFENLQIKSVKINPENVKKGDLFVCLKKDDEGRKKIRLAREKGASFFITEFDTGEKNQLVVKDTRKAFALIAKGLSNNACDKMKLIAVTGTNGKTSIVKILSEILQLAGKKVGTIGTLGSKFEGKSVDTGFTTPDPDILHGQLALMQKAGIEYVVMEASAHAIELKKLEGMKFEFAILTNVTQDHLDFFKDMEKYFEAKSKLFTSHYTKNAIICGDDKYGKRLTKKIEIPYLTYGFDKNNDVQIENFSQNESGMIFDCVPFKDNLHIKSRLVGEYNCQNLLAAILCAKYLGISEKEIASSVQNILPAEGRFNIIPFHGANIVIDYAHTPDGIEKILKNARVITKNKLFCVFGCGGNRDKLKRPIMGRIASQIADKVFLTSDNPRFENPDDILSQIEKGISGDYVKIPKREAAIKLAMHECKKGDTIVIAGKGAEKYQEICGVKYPYSDFDVINEIVKENEKEKK